MELKRAISVDQLTRTKFKSMKFEGAYSKSFGEQIQNSGSWIIYGESGHGKTSLAFMLAKYFTKFGRVSYNTIEEGARLSFQNALKRQDFSQKERLRFNILSESIADLKLRLKLKRAPDVIVIDSLQYTFLTKREYKNLIDTHSDKLFIWISHVEGKKPMGKLAKDVEYHSDVKIRVEGFRAFVKTRYEAGGQDFIIDSERVATYWNEII